MSFLAPVIFVVFFVIIAVAVGFLLLVDGVLNVWYGLIHTLFGGSDRSRVNDSTRGRRGDSDGKNSTSRTEKKIFSADEGTYVDFEEL